MNKSNSLSVIIVVNLLSITYIVYNSSYYYNNDFNGSYKHVNVNVADLDNYTQTGRYLVYFNDTAYPFKSGDIWFLEVFRGYYISPTNYGVVQRISKIYPNRAISYERSYYWYYKSWVSWSELTNNDTGFPIRYKSLGTLTSMSEVEAFLSKYIVNYDSYDKMFKSDIRVGDYITIAGYRCFVAGFDTEWRKGDTSTATHHIAFIADFGTTKMNETATTSGGYTGATTMQTFLYNKANELAAICGSHLLSRRCLLTNSVGTDGKSNGWAWTTCRLTLLSEQQVYGSMMYGNVFDTGEGYEKLPVFNYISPAALLGRTDTWLRGVYSANNFCMLRGDGRASTDSAHLARAALALFCLG